LTGDGSLIPVDPGPVGRPESKRPAKAMAAQGPVHQPSVMGLEPHKLRGECWELMGQRIKDRLSHEAGTLIEWYAAMESSPQGERPMAVVFGDQGLCIAEPRLSTDHRPVHTLSCYKLDPGSLRSSPVDHRPPPAARSTRQSAGPLDPQPWRTGLTEAQRGVLGNLPPEAQRLLQAPFLRGQEILRCGWYYQGHEHHLEYFIFYLAGPSDVTAACGTKTVPAGHSDETAHWLLRVYRASVVRRVGK